MAEITLTIWQDRRGTTLDAAKMTVRATRSMTLSCVTLIASHDRSVPCEMVTQQGLCWGES